MNGDHVLQSSPYVHQIMVAGSRNWWSINNMRPSSQPKIPSFLTPPSSPSLPISSSWNDSQELPESWSQLLLGGSGGEEDLPTSLNNMQMEKKIENWDEQLLHQKQTTNVVDVKQENSRNRFSSNMYGTYHGNNAELFHTISGNPSLSEMMPVSPPNSCVTTLSSNCNMIDFSPMSVARHPPPHSSECNSTAAGGVAKKARGQPSSTQSATLKVRKEKLGDRVTALHQIVSPFGKTDTASVLLEAIGYIRFLHNQVEALCSPYLDNGSGNMRHQQHVQWEMNCLFPEDPGQECEDQEPIKKDLRSRGLCLVPTSCTMEVGSDNGANYWAPTAFNGGFR